MADSFIKTFDEKSSRSVLVLANDFFKDRERQKALDTLEKERAY